MVPGYGRDDSDAGGGINLIAGIWKPPSRVTADEAAAARLWMRAHDAEADDQKPGYAVSAKDLHKWMATFLGNLAKGMNTTADESDLRVKLLSIAVDDRPAKHFTKESLKLAWDRFKFAPSANELMEFFDDLDSRERTEAQRIIQVLDVAAKPPAPQGSPVDVERSIALNNEKRDRERRELAAVVAEKFNVPPVPERGPGETDDAFMARLRHHRKVVEADATRAMKRFNPPKSAQPVERMEMAYQALRKAKADKPPAPPPGEDTAVCHGERLANMTPDPTTEDEP
jgi:hypothetical protein